MAGDGETHCASFPPSRDRCSEINDSAYRARWDILQCFLCCRPTRPKHFVLIFCEFGTRLITGCECSRFLLFSVLDVPGFGCSAVPITAEAARRDCRAARQQIYCSVFWEILCGAQGVISQPSIKVEITGAAAGCEITALLTV